MTAMGRSAAMYVRVAKEAVAAVLVEAEEVVVAAVVVEVASARLPSQSNPNN